VTPLELIVSGRVSTGCSTISRSRVLRNASVPSPSTTRLTGFQHDVLVQIARGKSRQLAARALKVTSAEINAALKVARGDTVLDRRLSSSFRRYTISR
jgi:hypothetical protein